jgi:hypothetical protein
MVETWCLIGLKQSMHAWLSALHAHVHIAVSAALGNHGDFVQLMPIPRRPCRATQLSVVIPIILINGGCWLVLPQSNLHATSQTYDFVLTPQGVSIRVV